MIAAPLDPCFVVLTSIMKMEKNTGTSPTTARGSSTPERSTNTTSQQETSVVRQAATVSCTPQPQSLLIAGTGVSALLPSPSLGPPRPHAVAVVGDDLDRIALQVLADVEEAKKRQHDSETWEDDSDSDDSGSFDAVYADGSLPIGDPEQKYDKNGKPSEDAREQKERRTVGPGRESKPSLTGDGTFFMSPGSLGGVDKGESYRQDLAILRQRLTHINKNSKMARKLRKEERYLERLLQNLPRSSSQGEMEAKTTQAVPEKPATSNAVAPSSHASSSSSASLSRPTPPAPSAERSPQAQWEAKQLAIDTAPDASRDLVLGMTETPVLHLEGRVRTCELPPNFHRDEALKPSYIVDYLDLEGVWGTQRVVHYRPHFFHPPPVYGFGADMEGFGVPPLVRWQREPPGPGETCIAEIVDGFLDPPPVPLPPGKTLVPSEALCCSMGGEVSYNGCARTWKENSLGRYLAGAPAECHLVNENWPSHFVEVLYGWGYMEQGPPIFPEREKEKHHASGWPSELIAAIAARGLSRQSITEMAATVTSALTMLRLDRSSTVGNERYAMINDLYYRLDHLRAETELAKAVGIAVENTLNAHADVESYTTEILRGGWMRLGIPWVDNLRFQVQLLITYLKRHPILSSVIFGTMSTVGGLGFSTQAFSSIATASLLSPVLAENFARLVAGLGTRYLPAGFLDSLRRWSGPAIGVLQEFWNWLRTAVSDLLGLPSNELRLGHVLWVLVLLPLFHVSWLTICGTVGAHLCQGSLASVPSHRNKLGATLAHGSQEPYPDCSLSSEQSHASPSGNTLIENKSPEKLERKILPHTMKLSEGLSLGSEPSISNALSSAKSCLELVSQECQDGQTRKFGIQKIPTLGSSWQSPHMSELHSGPGLFPHKMNCTAFGTSITQSSLPPEPQERIWAVGSHANKIEDGSQHAWTSPSMIGTTVDFHLHKSAVSTRLGEFQNLLTGLWHTCTKTCVDQQPMASLGGVKMVSWPLGSHKPVCTTPCSMQ